MQQYLLNVSLPNGVQFKQLFNTIDDVNDFIESRKFCFRYMDYCIYDLNIKKGRQS